MKPCSPISRRRFLHQTTAVAGAVAGTQFLGVPAVLSAPAPNAKLGVAVIGVGGMGGYSFGAGMGERLVAICDVDDNTITKAQKEFGEKHKDQPAPKAYFDYRKLLDECHRDLDVVLIATPDHHHAPAAIRAINLGKATFCQKPLAHNIYECQALAKAAREKKVLTQMGNQGALRGGDPPRLRVSLGWRDWERDRDALHSRAQFRRPGRPAGEQACSRQPALGRVDWTGAIPRVPRRSPHF